VQEVRRAFRPEFVNRLDRIIPFRPLTRDQIRDVARIALSRTAQRRGLLEIGLSLDVDDEALDALAREGFSDRYGARALRRHIEDRLIAPTSELLARNAWRAKGAVLRATVQPGGSALGLELVPGVAGPGGAMSSVRAEVSLRRREANQLFALERVDQVRDRIGFVLSQLNYGRFGKARTDKRVTIELNELSIEYHRLTKVLEAADAPRRDLETLEDMAIVSLFAGEDSPELRDEARERHERFEDRFVYVLIVLDPHPNEITLLLQADETRRVLDDWLVPFLAQASRERGWQTTLHVWDPKRSWPRRDDWPVDRSWSPPESAEVFLRRRERGAEALPRDVLLRVRGPYAGILLSLEAGIHRRTVEHEGKVAHHHMICTRVAMRTTLGEQEWTSEEIAPLATLPKREELALMDAVREYADKTRLLFVSSKRASLSIDPDPSEYWRNFERIALKHLLLYEDERLRLDREELWKGKLGAVPASDAPEAAR